MKTNKREKGQAVVEAAMSIPILVLLMFGAFNAGAMLSDKVIVSSAARAGARLASGIGGASRPDAASATATIDADIIQNVLTSVATINYASVTKITIYKPSKADGTYTNGDPADIYNASGTLQGSLGYPLTARIQTPPNQSPIGIRVDWTYKTPLGQSPVTLSMNEYVVMPMSPVEN